MQYCGKSSGDLKSSEYIQSSGRMLTNNELERIRKEVVVTCVKVMFWYLPGETEGNHDKPQSRNMYS
jgi:hypothetical protein